MIWPKINRSGSVITPSARRFHNKGDPVMSKVLSILLLGVALAVLPFAVQASEPKFIGVKSCSKCHKKKKQGNQLAIWKKSDHSSAYQTLGGDKAKEKAKELGVSGDPQKAEACLVCHTTGFGADPARFKKKFKMEQGVQCEACHGAGDKYRKKKTMKKIYKERGAGRDGDSPTAKKTGLIFPDENSCKRCHTKEIKWQGKTFKNPSYKDFDFKERAKKIEHPVPKK